MSVSPLTFKIYREIKGCKNSNANSKGFEPQYAAFAKKLTSDVKKRSNFKFENLNSPTHTFEIRYCISLVSIRGQ